MINRSIRATFTVVLISTAVILAEIPAKLLPSNLSTGKWEQFKAHGYSVPVTGIIFRGDDPRPPSGVPLGALATGCLDIETSGLFGYSSIFNHISPRGGPVNLPFLGISVEGKTWVLTTGETKQYYNGRLKEPPIGPSLELKGVYKAKSIDYWGHYPVVDMEYKTDAPVSVGLRAWSCFLPGDTKTSNTPGSVFEVHLRNISETSQTGCVTFSFPGFDEHKTKMDRDEVMQFSQTCTLNPEVLVWRPEPERPRIGQRAVLGNPTGVQVEDQNYNMSYVLAVMDEKKVRLGQSLDADGGKWSRIHKELPGNVPDVRRPKPVSKDPGASVAVDFELAPGERKIVRYVLAWYAPAWNGQGLPEMSGKVFTHMYARNYPDAFMVARYLTQNHESLFHRVKAWQQVLYGDKTIPGWLADSLINNLYFFPECSLWAQSKQPIGRWCKQEDGLFAMMESPRSCPSIETLVNGAFGNTPLVYFFPDCALSTLRGFKAYQWQKTGRVPFMFGWRADLTAPERGWHSVKTGANYMTRINRYWVITGDDEFFREFYDSAKLISEFAFNLRPEYGLSQIVSVPRDGLNFPYLPYETVIENRPYYGYVSYAGGLRMAHARMMRRWAQRMEDEEYVQKMDVYLEAGANILEEHLWNGKYYVHYNEPATGKSLDSFFTPQLEGQYLARSHGFRGVFPDNRVKTVLQRIREVACASNKAGIPPNDIHSKNADLNRTTVWYGSFGYVNTFVHYIAMLYMYEGQTDFGIDLLNKVRKVYSCRWGYTWEGVNITAGLNNTAWGGENIVDPDKEIGRRGYGTEYSMAMNLWEAPAAIANEGLSGPCKPGGLVDRIIKAARGE